MNALEITQDVPSNMNSRSFSHSNYKICNTAKAVTCVALNGTLVYCFELYPGSTSDDHCGVLSILKPSDMILAD